jgi:L-lactate dehydrogenase complex protein LldG
MATKTSREIILEKVKNALAAGKIEMPFPEADLNSTDVFVPQNEKDIAEVFAAEFIKLGGKFLYCDNMQEMLTQLNTLADANNWESVHCLEPDLLNFFSEQNVTFTKSGTNYANVEVAITGCEFLVARTGSLLLSSAGASGRALSVYTPIHICIARMSQLVWNIGDGTKKMQEKYGDALPSTFNIATGPSRTADIEKTLVVGVHGPKEVYVFLIND